MLGLEAESAMPWIHHAPDPGNGAVETVGRVKLYARLGREHFHHASRFRLDHARRQRERFAAAAQYEVVIVAGGFEAGLLVASAEGGRLCKVKRRAFDAFDFARWNQAFIRGCVTVGGQPKLVP